MSTQPCRYLTQVASGGECRQWADRVKMINPDHVHDTCLTAEKRRCVWLGTVNPEWKAQQATRVPVAIHSATRKSAERAAPWTAAEERRVRTLRNSGLSWASIARIVGRSEAETRRRWKLVILPKHQAAS